jgi:hypothetical protein
MLGGGDGKKEVWGRPGEGAEEPPPEEEKKAPEPNFGLSGALAAETNTVRDRTCNLLCTSSRLFLM